MLGVKLFNCVKRFVILFSLLLLPAVGFCANARLSLPALSSEEKPVLPVDSVMGQLVEPDETVFHAFLKEAICSEFGYEWLETYVEPNSKVAIAELFTQFLSENLPASDFVMSALSQNGDGSVSISVRINSTVVDFVVDGSYIVAMSIKKS